MKKLILYAGLCIIMIAAACNKIKSEHPQSGMMSSAEIDELDIHQYADSIDRLLPDLQKEESLIYTLGDYSFYATKYLLDARPVLYIEHGESGDFRAKTQRYYLKNGEPVLYISDIEYNRADTSFKIERAFFRNDLVFYSDSKSAVTKKELKTASYHKSETIDVNPGVQLAKLENAIRQRDEFNLVFEGITEYPKAKYLILSRNEMNAYRVPVLVEHEDDFIREISLNPDKYRGRKIVLDWELANQNEVKYVSGSLR